MTCSILKHITCSVFEHMIENEDQLNILRLIDKESKTSQRAIAQKLGYSLGKLNYCLRGLRKKGFVKVKNFRRNDNKLSYLYILTPKGIALKTNMVVAYLKRRAKEYELLKKEVSKNNNI